VMNKQGYVSNHVVSVVLKGEQQISTYEEELIKVKAGEVLFIPRGMYYITDLLPENGNFKSMLFYFDDAVIEQFLANTNVAEVSRKEVPSHLKFGIVTPVRSFTDGLINIYQANQITDKNFLNLKILELLYLLNSLVQEQDFASFLFRLTLPQKRNIKRFMEQNYDKPLKIEDYAYLTGRSISSFRRDFKTYFDTTPQKWIKEKRLTKSLKLLEENNMSITSLAYEAGYENISYFIKEFKKKYGTTPKQYILNERRNDETR